MKFLLNLLLVIGLFAISYQNDSANRGPHCSAKEKKDAREHFKTKINEGINENNKNWDMMGMRELDEEYYNFVKVKTCSKTTKDAGESFSLTIEAKQGEDGQVQSCTAKLFKDFQTNKFKISQQQCQGEE